MNTQAIKIIDEMIEELRKVSFPSEKVVSWVIYLKKARDKISSLHSLDSQWYTKKEVLDFAYWYHNWLLNRDRWDVEVEFDDFIKYHRKWLIPNN